MTRSRLIVLMLALGLLLMPVQPQAVFASIPSSAGMCNGTWQVQTSPSVANSILYGVAGTSTTDVWAVGTYIDSVDHFTKAFVEHWNGRNWKTVPAHGATSAALYGVSVRTPTDAWAVGNGGTGQSVGQTLVEHWNGTKWAKVRTPSLGTGFNSLQAVTVTSASDAWAVGYSQDSSFNDHSLTLHWNGINWVVVPSPSPGANTQLTGVSAASSTDVWAVGSEDNGTQTLILHWDGGSWAIMPSPSPGGVVNVLDGVAAASSTDAWAVGSYGSSGTGTLTLAEHWDGTSWTVVASENIGTYASYFQAVWASSGAAWAVGAFDQPPTVARTLTESWDGSSWTIVPSPNVGSTSNGLYSVWGASPTDVYAVGTVLSAGLQNQNLIEHYC
jgi:hypothetical protein